MVLRKIKNKIKKTTMFLICTGLFVMSSFAGSWTSSGNDVYYNAGKVGIGSSSTPEVEFHVVGQVKITDHIFLSGTKQLFLDGGGNTYISEVTGDQINIVAGNTEMMRITNGSIGIGTTNPVASLEISRGDGVDNPVLRLNRNDQGDRSFIKALNSLGQTVVNLRVDGYNHAALDLNDKDGNSKVVINSSNFSYFNGGKVGIGTSSPSELLEVNGGTSGATIQVTSTGTNQNAALAFQGSKRWQMGTNREGFGGHSDAFYLRYESGMVPFVVRESGKIGIGTDEPEVTLHVEGKTKITDDIFLNSTKKLFLDGGTDTYIGQVANDEIYFVTNNSEAMRIKDKNVGIGNYNPVAKLEVSRGDGIDNPVLRLNRTDQADRPFIKALNSAGQTVFIVRADGGNHGALDLQDGSGNNKVLINSSNYSYFNGGNVGIGTGSTPPTELLEVAGDAKITGILSVANLKATNVEFANVPDYVFDENYDLPNLSTVESFVKSKKHLPDVPSAKEMTKEGVDLIAMNMALLKKVEELTLYTIEQEKKINAHDVEVENYRELIKNQNDRITKIESLINGQ